MPSKQNRLSPKYFQWTIRPLNNRAYTFKKIKTRFKKNAIGNTVQSKKNYPLKKRTVGKTARSKKHYANVLCKENQIIIIFSFLCLIMVFWAKWVRSRTKPGKEFLFFLHPAYFSGKTPLKALVPKNKLFWFFFSCTAYRQGKKGMSKSKCTPGLVKGSFPAKIRGVKNKYNYFQIKTPTSIIAGNYQ